MSLNFNLTEVAKNLGPDYDRITTSPETQDLPAERRKRHPVTETIIWMSLAVDLNEITKNNVDEWVFRMNLLNALPKGSVGRLQGDLGSFLVNRLDIVNHIGMKTNAANRTRAAWLARIFRKGSYDAKALEKDESTLSAASQINNAYAAKNAA